MSPITRMCAKKPCARSSRRNLPSSDIKANLRRDDFERVIAYLVDLRCDLLTN